MIVCGAQAYSPNMRSQVGKCKEWLGDRCVTLPLLSSTMTPRQLICSNTNATVSAHCCPPCCMHPCHLEFIRQTSGRSKALCLAVLGAFGLHLHTDHRLDCVDNATAV